MVAVWQARLATPVPTVESGPFNVDGNPKKAHGYFKNIAGQTIDTFDIFAD
jgi:hypothetical protein